MHTNYIINVTCLVTCVMSIDEWLFSFTSHATCQIQNCVFQVTCIFVSSGASYKTYILLISDARIKYNYRTSTCKVISCNALLV